MTLERIAAIGDPAVRLDVLRTLVLSELVLPVSLRTKCSGEGLVKRIELISQSASAAKYRLATADAARMPRLSIDDLVRALTYLVFREFVPTLSLDEMECQLHLPMQELSSLQQRILSLYLSLLSATSHWMLGFYNRTPLHQAVRELPESERDEFFWQCDELAKVFHDSFHWSSTSNESMAAECRRKEILDRARELRVLALAATSSEQLPLPSDGGLLARSGARTLDWVNLGLKQERPTYGAIAVDGEQLHLWCSGRWSKKVAPLVEMAAKANLLLEDWNAALKAFGAENDLSAAKVFGEGAAVPVGATIRVADHTRCGLPLSCILDGRRDYCWTTSVPNTVHAARNKTADRRVRFWGQFEYHAMPRITISEERREVLYESRPCFTYPDKEEQGMRLKGSPRPLPYAYFERWFLEDARELYGIDVLCRYGDCPTRAAFLSEAEFGSGILHITTHGDVDDDVECSHLLFAQEDDSPTVVHVLDILARDWSSYDAVLLNACLTSAGKKPVGEEALSLAWAFLAGGASAVIGCRWRVDDKVTWQFCRGFYTHYFGAEKQNNESLRRAFAHAVNTMDVDRPGDWGSFVLLS